MKKFLFIIALVLMMSVCSIVNAAGGSATLNGNNAVTVGSNIVFTVNLSGCDNASSVAVNVSFGKDFEFVSAEWLKSGMINNPYDVNTGKGALGGLSSADINGNIYRLTLKAKTANANAQTVKVGIIAKNGGNEIFNNVASKSVKINCVTHSYGDWTKADSTHHKHTCSYCGNIETSGHSWNSGEITENATCKQTGNKKYACTVCGEIKNETIAKTDNHNFGDWIITKNPSCEGKGTKTRTCSICQKNESTDINATGHSMGSWTTTTEPKCTTKGIQTRTCSKCSHSETRNIDATGHSMGSWTTTTEPKCTTKGIQTRKCSKCSHTETKNIDATGHSFSKPIVTKQPTCTQTGVESGTCSRCGQTTTNTIKATGHKFGNWTIKTSATCVKTGVEERKCSVCNTFETRNSKALGHDFENPTIVKESTLATTGLKEGKCKRCDEITSEVIPCFARDEITGTEIKVDEGVFQKGTTMRVEKLREDAPIYDNVKEITKKFIVYDITTVHNNAKIQPNGIVQLTFKIPTEFSENLALYFVSDNGEIEKLESKVNDNGSITADVESLGNYAICDLEASNGTDLVIDNEDKNTDTRNIYVYIIIGMATLVIIGGVVAFVVGKKKK